MTEHDRREFLKKLAKTAVYSAPVITSLAAPIDLVGQGQSSEHKHHTGAAPARQMGQTTNTTPQAPWDKPPPGKKP